MTTEQVSKEKTEKPSEDSSGRRGFIRRLVGAAAVTGLATSLLGRVAEKPLIQTAYGANDDPVTVGNEFTGTKETKITSDLSIGGDAAIKGSTSKTTGMGLWGDATATSGANYGVYGRSYSSGGYGVKGYAIATSGAGIGVQGMSDSPNGIGVQGSAANAGTTPIVAQGFTTQTADLQVWRKYDATKLSVVDKDGKIGAGTASPSAMVDARDSASGVAIYGETSNIGDSTKGIHGVISSTTPGNYSAGVRGENKGTGGNGVGVYGSQAGGGWGVYGQSNTGRGVCGTSNTGTGVYGSGYTGVQGEGAPGVLGKAIDGNSVPIMARAYQSGGQFANLQEWQNSSGAALSAVDKDGKLGIGIASPVRQIHLQGNNAVFRMDRDANSSAFMLVRTAAGDFGTIWKTFYVGVNASGVNNGSFFIGDVGNNVSGPSTVRLAIDNSGNVGVGTEIPGYLLDVAGQAHATSFPTSSDERFKDEVTPLENVLDRLNQIHGVTFEWNNLYASLGRATEGRQIGLIAQEVEKNFPELVSRWKAEDMDDCRAVDYGRFTAVLLEAIKELHGKLEQLQEEKSREIEKLQTQVTELTQRLNN